MSGILSLLEVDLRHPTAKPCEAGGENVQDAWRNYAYPDMRTLAEAAEDRSRLERFNAWLRKYSFTRPRIIDYRTVGVRTRWLF